MTRAALPVLAALVALLPGACASDPTRGYAFVTGFDDGVRSVAVPVFGNDTFYSGLEMQLTEAIAKEIQRSTPWVVTRAAGADTTLSGTITDSTLTQRSHTPVTGLVQELAVEITVSFEWRDNRSGDSIVARERFRGVSTFVPARGTGERIETGQRDAIDRLARDIVHELRSNW